MEDPPQPPPTTDLGYLGRNSLGEGFRGFDHFGGGIGFDGLAGGRHIRKETERRFMEWRLWAQTGILAVVLFL